MTEQKWLTSDDPQVMLNELEFRRQWFNTKGGQDRCISDRKLRLFACACCRGVWHLLTDARSCRAVEVAERQADRTHDSTEWGRAHNDAVAARVGLAYGSDEWHAAAMAENAVMTVPNVAAILRDQTLIRSLYPDQALARRLQAALLREVAGNPFRPVTLPKGTPCCLCKGKGHIERPVICGPNTSEAEMRRLADEAGGDIPCPSCRSTGHQPCPWLTPQVLSLAQAAYDERPGRKCPNCRFNEAWADGGWFRCGKCKDGHIDDGTLDPHRLAVLADALEEAGCPSEEKCGECPVLQKAHVTVGGYYDRDAVQEVIAWGKAKKACRCGGVGRVPHPILAHLRSLGPHVRGCWVLDILLGLA